jgi:hypothetical protein
MKKTFLSMTIIVFLLLCSSGIQAQDETMTKTPQNLSSI